MRHCFECETRPLAFQAQTPSGKRHNTGSGREVGLPGQRSEILQPSPTGWVRIVPYLPGAPQRGAIFGSRQRSARITRPFRPHRKTSTLSRLREEGRGASLLRSTKPSSKPRRGPARWVGEEPEGLRRDAHLGLGAEGEVVAGPGAVEEKPAVFHP